MKSVNIVEAKWTGQKVYQTSKNDNTSLISLIIYCNDVFITMARHSCYHKMTASTLLMGDLVQFYEHGSSNTVNHRGQKQTTLLFFM